MSDNFNMYDQANQQGNPNIPPMPPMEEKLSLIHIQMCIRDSRESGDGFSDILIEPEDPDAGIVIEVKYTKEMKELDAACEACLLYTSNRIHHDKQPNASCTYTVIPSAVGAIYHALLYTGK